MRYESWPRRYVDGVVVRGVVWISAESNNLRSVPQVRTASERLRWVLTSGTNRAVDLGVNVISHVLGLGICPRASVVDATGKRRPSDNQKV